jgi:A/G-specific adenine glycosylase
VTPHQRKITTLVTKLLEWYSANARDLPWRRTRDPYAIHVSEIMLQQTQVKTVIPYWERWMRELPTLEAAAKASSAEIHKLWEGLGYYTRVRNLQKAAQTILERHAGVFPETFEAVLELPGIGRYTAGAICSIAFNQPKPILDGNVVRVLTRIFGIADNPREKKTNAELWQLAGALVSEAAKLGAGERVVRPSSALNQSLMELGALICTPRLPQCLICPARSLCQAFKGNLTTELPNLGKREAATARRFVAFVVEHNGKFLVRQRPENTVNGHLWEFPNVEVDGQPVQEAALAKKLLGITPVKLESLTTLKHSITRYRITLNAFAFKVTERPVAAEGVWKSPAQMRRLAFTAAHKKLVSLAIQRILSDR